MKIRLWQVSPYRNYDRLMFCGLNEWKAAGNTPEENGAAYDMVFEGEVPCEDLEHVFIYFNRNDDINRIYNGKPFRSMSVSDIVELLDANDDRSLGLYFCDRFGFAHVSGGFTLGSQPKKTRISKHELNLKIILEGDRYSLQIEEPVTGSTQDFSFPLGVEGDCADLCRILGTNVDSWVHLWKEES